MPKAMLERMLGALCRRGAEFCRPGDGMPVGVERQMEVALSRGQAYSGFFDDFPGSGYFHPHPLGNEPYYPMERHASHVEMIMLLSGCVDFFIRDSWHLLQEERVHVLLRNTAHTERQHGGRPYDLVWLACLPSSLVMHRTSFTQEAGYRQSACRIALATPMAEALWECGSAAQVDEPHYFSLLVQCLDHAVHQNLMAQGLREYNATVMSQIRRYLDENFHRPIGIGELTQLAHYSAVHLNRSFLRQYGVSVHQYVMERRLEEAKRLLAQGAPPGEAARKSGFAEQRYFSRVFRQRTGMTPSAYAQGKSPRGE